jgi:hypothetical protein
MIFVAGQECRTGPDAEMAGSSVYPVNPQSSPLQQALPLVSEEGFSEEEDHIGKLSYYIITYGVRSPKFIGAPV